MVFEKFKNFIIKLASSKQKVFFLILTLAIIASVQSYLESHREVISSGIKYTNYNNYIIYKKSFDHLITNQNLYSSYLEQHWDLFRYSPTFALGFFIFSILPDYFGLIVWNFLNALVLLFAVYYLPKLSNIQKGFIILLFMIELMTSMQNEQSNALIAGLLIFSFGLLENKKYAYGILFLMIAAFIKPFAIIGMVLLLLYREKVKMAAYSILIFTILACLPLILIDAHQLLAQYNNWFIQIKSDHGSFYGMSLMGVLHSWLSMEINKMMVVILGLLVLISPYTQFKKFQNYDFRLLSLCSVLIYIVVFNHKAESPTFIIAMSGVSIWYIWKDTRLLNKVLMISAYILTSLSPTDIFPSWIRDEITDVYVLKALPCILIWIKIIYDQWNTKNEINSTNHIDKVSFVESL